MVDVVVNNAGTQTANVGGVMELALSPIMFFMSNWYWFILAIIIIVLFSIVMYMVFYTLELKKQRDEPGYYAYKQALSDLRQNSNPKYLRKYYSLKNLFWLGIPILWNDGSARIMDRTNRKLGTYRGEYKSQDGYHNLLICTGSILGYFESLMILKVPYDIKYETASKEKKSMKFDLIDYFDHENSIRVDCLGTERCGIYYTIPIIEVKKDKEYKVLDIREFVEGKVADNTYQVMTQRLLNLSAKQMEKAMMNNPDLKFKQYSPQKTTPEQNLDDEE